MGSLARYFLRGLLITVPVALTVYVVVLVLGLLDRLLPIGIPGLGLVMTLGLITLVGVLTSNVIGRTLYEEFERGLTRLPLVKLVYSSVKDLMSAFVGDKKSFDRPVAVEITAEGHLVLGFITREELSQLGLPGSVAVYLPQAYNFAGQLLLCPRDKVRTVDVPTAEAMTFIVSGGVSGFAQVTAPSADPSDRSR